MSTYAYPSQPRGRGRVSLAYPTLLLLGVLDAAGYSLLAPVLPSIAEATGAGPALIGLFVASFSFAMLFGFALAGQAVRRGHSLAIMLVSLGLICVGSLGFVLGEGLAVYFAARAVMGLGSGGVWIAVTFNTLERWPGQEYLCMSRIFAAYSVGGLLGPALGAIGGIRTPFLVYLSLVLAAAPLAILMGEPGQRRSFGSAASALRLPGFVLASAAILFTWVAFGTLEGVLPLHFAGRLSQAGIAALFIGTAVVVATSAALAARLRPLVATCAAIPLVVLGVALVGAVDAVPLWSIALLLAGIGMGACNTGSTGVLLETVGMERIVLAMVVWSQIGIVGYLVGPALGGAVTEELGFRAAGLAPLAAAAGVIAILLWMRARPKETD